MKWGHWAPTEAAWTNYSAANQGKGGMTQRMEPRTHRVKNHRESHFWTLEQGEIVTFAPWYPRFPKDLGTAMLLRPFKWEFLLWFSCPCLPVIRWIWGKKITYRKVASLLQMLFWTIWEYIFDTMPHYPEILGAYFQHKLLLLFDS